MFLQGLYTLAEGQFQKVIELNPDFADFSFDMTTVSNRGLLCHCPRVVPCGQFESDIRALAQWAVLEKGHTLLRYVSQPDPMRRRGRE